VRGISAGDHELRAGALLRGESVAQPFRLEPSELGQSGAGPWPADHPLDGDPGLAMTDQHQSGIGFGILSIG
jgi:hypothetical protein